MSLSTTLRLFSGEHGRSVKNARRRFLEAACDAAVGCIHHTADDDDHLDMKIYNEWCNELILLAKMWRVIDKAKNILIHFLNNFFTPFLTGQVFLKTCKGTRVRSLKAPVVSFRINFCLRPKVKDLGIKLLFLLDFSFGLYPINSHHCGTSKFFLLPYIFILINCFIFIISLFFIITLIFFNIISLFLTATEGQRPRNYSSWCSCWIFCFKNSLNLSLSLYFYYFSIFLFFLSFYCFLSPNLSIILLYMSSYLGLLTNLPTYVYLPMSTYLCLPSFIYHFIYLSFYIPTLSHLHFPTYTYPLTPTYLCIPTYAYLSMSTYINIPTYAYPPRPTYLHQHTYLGEI